jgi:hypothetical protein
MRLRVGNKSISSTLESIWVEVQRGSIPAGVTPSALEEIKTQIGVTPTPPPPPPTTPWILANGFWNDNGEWQDSATWEEYGLSSPGFQ